MVWRVNNVDTAARFQSKDFGYCFGYCLLQNAQKPLKKPANGRSASLSFLSTDSKSCEEFRSGQEKQMAGFESAAYANFATPARASTQPNILQINASTQDAYAVLLFSSCVEKTRGTEKDSIIASRCRLRRKVANDVY